MATRIRHETTIMISDVHVGDPANAALEDFDRDDDFARLLGEVIPGRARGSATLIIAGDFIDFPQILPELAKTSPGNRYGTTEEESTARVRCAIEGHPTVFSALRSFLEAGNQVLVLPGNHDIDLHFPGVRDELRRALGASSPEEFEFIPEGFLREKHVYIEHGNQYSFDNHFEHWHAPILDAPDGKRRIERPWGTLFMDEIYNEVEAAYPFVNRVFPHAALAWALLRSDTLPAFGLLVRLVAFFATKGKRFIGERVLGTTEDDDRALDRRAIEGIVENLDTRMSHEQKRDVVEEVARLTGATSEGKKGAGSKLDLVPGLLGRTDANGLERRALEILRSGTVDVVAFGHTHHPVERTLLLGGRGCRLFNTGGWIPSIEIPPGTPPSLEEMRTVTPAHDLRYLVIDFGPNPSASLEKLGAT